MAVSDSERRSHASHFQDLSQQADAAKLGMLVFLASEVLLFAGLFALYCGYRAHHPAAFAEGVRHNSRVLGTLNTLVLIGSSYVVASAVTLMRRDRRGATIACLVGATVLGAVFLAVKAVEYRQHFVDGIFPGGRGLYFAGREGTSGMSTFYTLYFLTTGLHAIHVVAGMSVLAGLTVGVARRRIRVDYEHPLSIGAMYWHLVDVIWIFLWPMFYLMHGG
jgi:cytochrome c oxidase subunit 3